MVEAQNGTVAVTTSGKRWRVVVTIVMFGVLLFGNLWGQDDLFPMGPFRMYASRQRLDGRISWYSVMGVRTDGKVRFIPGADYGMRRAELEGQAENIKKDPTLLCDMADVRDKRAPEKFEVVEVRLIRYSVQLEDGQPVGEATWKKKASCVR